MKRLCLAITLLALPVVFIGSASAQQTFDHYLCYFAPNQPVLQIPFELQDQFDVDFFEIMSQAQIMRFCTPVQKVLKDAAGNITQTFPIVNPAGHMTLWQFNPQPIIPRQVQYTNQFGKQTLFTSDPRVLAMPTGKALPPKAAPAPPPNLDHYKCYVASGPNANVTVWLSDQFITNVAFSVLQPVLFCNPTKKLRPAVPGTPTASTTAIQFPNNHLTCYAITPFSFATNANINNQFVVQNLAFNTPDMLCAPSTLQFSLVILPPPPPVVESGAMRSSGRRQANRP
jgi:hypothetical protein